MLQVQIWGHKASEDKFEMKEQAERRNGEDGKKQNMKINRERGQGRRKGGLRMTEEKHRGYFLVRAGAVEQALQSCVRLSVFGWPGEEEVWGIHLIFIDN